MNDPSMLPKHYYICRVCGLDLSEYYSDPPWDPEGYGSQDICPCCGVQFGYQDSWLKGIKKHRTDWLAEGGNWRDPELKPENWSLEEQMKKIPEEFR